MTLDELKRISNEEGPKTFRYELFEGHIVHIRVFAGEYRLNGSGGARYHSLNDIIMDKVIV